MDKVTCQRAVNSKGAHIIHGNQHARAGHRTESIAYVFPLCFQLPYLPEETCFQLAGSSPVLARLYWDFLTSGGFHSACHYF
jgi:hypothetical protein